MKVLALDYGRARTGVAVSDPTGTLARPLGVVERAATEPGLKRLAVGGSYQHGGWSIIGTGGIHLRGNAGHVTGVNASRWVWRVGMTYRFHREGALGDLTP